MGISAGVDIDEVLDTARLRPIHLRTLAVCTAVMMIDGYDLYVVGWILPALSDSFNVSRVALTPVLLIQQAGMLLSVCFVAPLADRFGRRTLLLACLAGTGLCCLGAASSANAIQFTLWRVLTGLFAAAVVPNLVTLSSEMAPRRLRATFTTITVCGAQGGTLIGAAMQAFILPRYGWAGALFLGCALPALIMPIVLPWLPESPRFMVRRNSSDPRLPRLIAKVDPTLDPATPLYAATSPQLATGARDRIAALLGEGRRFTTVLLWCAFISSFAFIGQWSSWSTTVFKDVLHMDWKSVATVITLYSSLGVVGASTVGFAIDRFGFRTVLPSTYALAFIGAVGVGMTAPGSPMFIFLGMMGLFQISSQAGLAALAPTLYPPSHKATAVGWAYGAGRVGSIIGPATGSALMQLHLGPAGTFSGLALPLVFVSVLLLILIRRSERPPTVALTAHEQS
jgi:MFS transporter, AAHS family, 4-hydroxybenzoate transporter